MPSSEAIQQLTVVKGLRGNLTSHFSFSSCYIGDLSVFTACALTQVINLNGIYNNFLDSFIAFLTAVYKVIFREI